MNNIKYYNDSLAYDFQLFIPKVKTVEKENENIIPLPRVKERSRAKKRVAAKKLTASAFAVMTSVFILFALCGNIFLRLRINEVNSDINTIKSEIESAKSERTSLAVDFERKISFYNIELEATELGMQKMDKSQVKYIRVNQNNTAVTKNGTTVSSVD